MGCGSLTVQNQMSDVLFAMDVVGRDGPTAASLLNKERGAYCAGN
jgi:hypothetical protein